MKSHLRLRLAARTLIEWNTPTSSPLYRQVLEKLLEAHPSAQAGGLTIHSSVLKVDKRGIILWYLSETLSDQQYVSSEYAQRTVFTALQRVSISYLTDFALTKASNEK